MKLGRALAIAAIMLGTTPLAAQDWNAGTDGGYYDQGYYGDVPDERDYGTRPPPPGAARPMPGYRDKGNWRRSETWSSGDARTETVPDYPVVPPAPPRAPTKGNARAYADAQADYRARLDAWTRKYGTPSAEPRDRDRIARWRARADACEAGDRAACDGPE